MGKVTIKDIAALFNTSPKTVSKALNNQPGVSDALRQKIKQKARELYYIPNVFGKGLSGVSLKTIGVIVPENVNPAYSLILSGIEKKATELHYSIILGNSNEDTQREKDLIQVLLGKQVDGVIFCPAYHPTVNPNIALFQQYGIPYILINRAPRNHQDRCIQAHNFEGAYLAGRYLVQKGHSRILHLTRKYSILAVEDRIAGLKKALNDCQLELPEHNIYRCCEVSMESAYTETLKILQQRQDFTAIFAFNDIIAFGVIKAILDAQRRIPSDIAVMGFDNVPFSDICLVPLTTVNQHLYAIGTISMEALLKQITCENNSVVTALPEPYVVERQSV